MCKAPKFFGFESDPGVIVQDKKLTEEKVRFIIIQKCNGVTTKEIARDLKVSQRRVQQVIKAHREAGQEPRHRRRIGRPNKPYDEKEAEIVKSA